MKDFDFVAFNSFGEKKKVIIRARSLLEAKRKIQRRGFYLASIQGCSAPYSQNSYHSLRH